MIGFAGTRRVNARLDGLVEQHIYCRNAEEIKFWEAIFPRDNQYPPVSWPGETTVLLGKSQHALHFQGSDEIVEWRGTLPEHPMMRAFVKWTGPNSLIITSEVKAGAEVIRKGPALETMSDPQLRTLAAELDLEVTQTEARATLIERIRLRQMSLSAAT